MAGYNGLCAQIGGHNGVDFLLWKLIGDAEAAARLLTVCAQCPSTTTHCSVPMLTHPSEEAGPSR